MTGRCDFCGEEFLEVVRTNYGSTNYTRLICQDCIKAANDYAKVWGKGKVLNEDGTFVEDTEGFVENEQA